MFKKIVAIAALAASTSFAVWDLFPIMPNGMGQVRGQLIYTDQDPLTSLTSTVGARYSVADWIEVALNLDYRLFTHFDGDDVGPDGFGYLAPGLRFQVTPVFSIFGDVMIPLDDESYTGDVIRYDFGIQHASIWSRLIWGTSLEVQMNTETSVVIFAFEDEFDIVLGQVVPYIGFNLYMGEDFGPGGEGANGFEIPLGIKFGVSERLSLDVGVHFMGGDLFEIYGCDDPMIMGFEIAYIF